MGESISHARQACSMAGLGVSGLNSGSNNNNN